LAHFLGHSVVLKPTSCYHPKPNFIVTDIAGQNPIFCWYNRCADDRQ